MSALRFHGDRVPAPEVLDFAVNVWPQARPAWLDEALRRVLRGERYPEERAAIAAIARRHGRHEDEVLLANGACEVFWLLAVALRPRLAVCVHPSFTEPEAALRAAGVPVVRVQRVPPRWELLSERVPDDADLVVLGNPNNPTGTLDPAAAIAALARPGRVLVVDEAFIHFIPGETESLADRSDLPGLVVVRSLTKLWSLAGVRAGYALAPPAIVERFRASRQPWSVNSLACTALEACASDWETPARVAREVAAARTALVEELHTLRLSPYESVANFLLLEVADGRRVVAALAERGIAVRPADSFPGLDERHVRIAVRPPEDNAVLVRALAEVLDAA